MLPTGPHSHLLLVHQSQTEGEEGGEGARGPPLTPGDSIVRCASCAFHRRQGQNVQV